MLRKLIPVHRPIVPPDIQKELKHHKCFHCTSSVFMYCILWEPASPSLSASDNEISLVETLISGTTISIDTTARSFAKYSIHDCLVLSGFTYLKHYNTNV